MTKAKAVRYSSTSNTTKAVCEKLNFNFKMHFVETLVRADGKILVRGTCGKFNEFSDLVKGCVESGWLYTGKIGKRHYARAMEWKRLDEIEKELCTPAANAPIVKVN
jgi:hypothetical protein